MILNGNKKYILKYQRKMPMGEVQRMKSFVTKDGMKITKTPEFKVISMEDQGSVRVFRVKN